MASVARMQVHAVRSHAAPTWLPLVLAPGDEVEVGERSTEWPAFVFVTAKHGQGWVPERNFTTDRPRTIAAVQYDTVELTVSVGDVLLVLDRDDESGWWWCQAGSGHAGWVPIEVLEVE